MKHDIHCRSHDSYFLETEDEFYDRIEQGSGMTM